MKNNSSEQTDTLKSRTAKGLLWGFLNNGTMQLLNMVFGIVLARMLSRSDYGLAGEVGIFSAGAAALQESGFISALTNRRNPTSDDYNSVFWFNVTVSAAIYAVLWFCAPLIVAYFHEPELLWLSRYAFLGFFCASFSITPRAILFRQLKVKEQSIIGISALLCSGGVGIVMALCGMSYWSLVTQGIVYVSVISVLSWKWSGFRPQLRFKLQPIREMFAFSCKLLITNVFNCINNSVFTLAFGTFYSKLEVGTYTQADKWNKMGSQLITGMVQGVSQPMFVQVGEEQDRLQRAFRKMLRFTSLISFPAMFGLAMVASEFIVVLVGRDWLASAELMRMLCVAGAFMPITALYFNFLISRGRSDVYMWNILAQGILVLGVLCLVHYGRWHVVVPPLSCFGASMGSLVLEGVHLMVVSYVVIYILWLLVWHYYLRREIKLSIKDVVCDMAPFALTAAAAMCITYVLTRGISNLYLSLIVRMLLAAVLYVGGVWLTGAQILRESVAYITKKKRA